jgi:hypothetical protein
LSRGGRAYYSFFISYHLSQYLTRHHTLSDAIHMKKQIIAVLFGAFLVMGCNSTTSMPPVKGVALAQLPWCSHPVIAFTDESVIPNEIIGDWATAQRRLTFVPLLPPTLPGGTCLFAAGGVVGDPIFQSRFSITYILADGSSLSIAEAPEREQIPQPICTTGQDSSLPSATCQVTNNGINVTLSGKQQTTASLQDLIKSLKPGVEWNPKTGSK